MHQQIKLDFLWAGLCLLGAVYFIFRRVGWILVAGRHDHPRMCVQRGTLCSGRVRGA